MWRAIAEENMQCDECFHDIRAGTACLSQMPEVMPEKFRRKKYDNYCVYCIECAVKDKPPCYARQFPHWYALREEAKESIPCGYCGDAIRKGDFTPAQKIYAWPEPEIASVQTDNAVDGDAPIGSAASGAAAASAAKSGGLGAWHNLSQDLQSKFITGGLRGGSRTPAMARRLYEKEVPAAVRNLGEDAVVDFLKGRHFSHIKSVSNAPSQARLTSNVILEDGAKNMARGSRNMTSAEIAAARSAGRAAALKIGVKSALKGGAKAGAIAAAMEAPVSGAENFLHWKRGRKTGKQAAKAVAKDTGVAAGVGIAAAGVVKVAAVGVAKGAAMAGIGMSLGPFGTPLMIAGGGLMVAAAAHRIIKAGKRDLPLDKYYIHFCKDTDCKTRFALAIIEAAARPAAPSGFLSRLMAGVRGWQF